MAERKHKIVFHQQEIAAMYDRIIGNDNNLSIYMKMIQLVKAGAFEDLGLSRIVLIMVLLMNVNFVYGFEVMNLKAIEQIKKIKKEELE